MATNQFSNLAAAALAKPKEAGNRMFEVAGHFADLLALPKEQVRAHEVSKPENLKVRFIPRPRKRENIGLAVVSGGNVERTAAEAADLINDGSFKTMALAVEGKGAWAVASVVSIDPPVAEKISKLWPNAIVRMLARESPPASGAAIVDAPLDVACFEGFKPAAFQFLADLGANNDKVWMHAHHQEFLDLVDRPLRCLITALGPHMLRLSPGLETRPSAPETMAKINRQNTVNGVYRTHYWAAFYRKSQGRKQADVQLYLTLTPDGFSHGLYFGEGAAVAPMARRLRELVAKRPDEVRAILDEAGITDHFQFGGKAELEASLYHLDAPDGLGSWTDETWPRAFHLEPPSDLLLADPQALVEHVAEDFTRLWPLFVMATTADDPIIAARAALEGEPAEEIEIEEEESDLDLAGVASATCLSEETLRRMERALVRKRQIVLNGPPGTGKTFVAKILAEYFAGSKDRVELVQFHPSYAYEDFIEGIRARTIATASGRHELDYGVESGIFRLLCDRARLAPGKHFVLLIDEINRGNVARIFGELLFLLEYRKDDAKLAYSRERFQIPENLYVIGTMNTADRSIALVDFALRRRFSFIEMRPDEKVLTCWLDDHDAVLKQEILEVWERVNRDIDKADYKIGHSHFMYDHTPESLRDLWLLDLRPYLAEYFFATPDRVKAIGTDVEAILKRAEKPAAP